jgi:hypothetical protein
MHKIWVKISLPLKQIKLVWKKIILDFLLQYNMDLIYYMKKWLYL